MKNKNYVTVMFILLISGIGFSLNSCKKDEIKKQDVEQINPDYVKLMKKIDNFRFDMHSTDKTDESMAIDSAIWYLEALVTFDEAYPDSTFRDFTIIESFYEVELDENNMVSQEDLQEIYDQMVDTIDYHLSLFDDENKFAVFSDLSLVEEESRDGTGVIAALNGYGFGLLLGIYYPFEEDDDWIWGTIGEGTLGIVPLGKCDGSEYGVSDGSNEIVYRLNNPAAQSPPSVYTDIVTFEINYVNCWYNEPPQLPRVFSKPTSQGDYCMDNEELTFFLEAAHLIKTDYNDPINDIDVMHIVIEDGEGARPDGKDFMSIDIADQLNYSDNKFFHNCFFTFGKVTSAGTD